MHHYMAKKALYGQNSMLLFQAAFVWSAKNTINQLIVSSKRSFCFKYASLQQKRHFTTGSLRHKGNSLTAVENASFRQKSVTQKTSFRQLVNLPKLVTWQKMVPLLKKRHLAWLDVTQIGAFLWQNDVFSAKWRFSFQMTFYWASDSFLA